MAKGLGEETIAADYIINITTPVPTSYETLDPVVHSTVPATEHPRDEDAIKKSTISKVCKEFCLKDTNHQIEELSNNAELLSLVEKFCECYIKGSELCTSLNDYCLMNLTNWNLNSTVQAVAVKIFLKEIPNLNYKTSSVLVEGSFFSFQSTHEQMKVSMLKEFKLGKKKLDEKLKRIELWRRVSGTTFVAAYVSSIIFSFVTTEASSPPLVLAFAGLLTVSLDSCTGRLNDWLFNTRVNATTKQQMEKYKSLKVAADLIANHNLDETSHIFNRSKEQFDRFLATYESSLNERDNTINDMKENLEACQNTIRLLSKNADMFARCIREATKIVIEKVIKDAFIY